MKASIRLALSRFIPIVACAQAPSVKDTVVRVRYFGRVVLLWYLRHIIHVLFHPLAKGFFHYKQSAIDVHVQAGKVCPMQEIICSGLGVQKKCTRFLHVQHAVQFIGVCEHFGSAVLVYRTTILNDPFQKGLTFNLNTDIIISRYYDIKKEEDYE